MNGKIKEALTVLLGSDKLADEFEQLADSANQDIEENTIHQAVEEEVEIADEVIEEDVIVEEEEEEVEEEVKTDGDIELDETFIDDMLIDLVGHDGFNQMVQNLIVPLVNRIAKLETELATVRQNQQNIEVSIQEEENKQHTMWENDKPRRKVSYRARGNNVVDKPVQSGNFQDTANGTLNKIKRGVK